MPTGVAVGAMRGDHAPGAVVVGNAGGLTGSPEPEGTFAGNGSQIMFGLAGAGLDGKGMGWHLVHLSPVKPMTGAHVEALQTGWESSAMRIAAARTQGNRGGGTGGKLDGPASPGNRRFQQGRRTYRGEAWARIESRVAAT